jgi:hypothetical protein
MGAWHATRSAAPQLPTHATHTTQPPAPASSSSTTPYALPTSKRGGGVAALREQLQGQVGAGEARWREREGYGAAPTTRPPTIDHTASAPLNGIADLQIDDAPGPLSISVCSRMLTRMRTCAHTYAHACSRMLTYAGEGDEAFKAKAAAVLKASAADQLKANAAALAPDQLKATC